MKNLGLLIRSLVLFSVMSSSLPSFAERLDLSEGTMTIGGGITFNINAMDISNLAGNELGANIAINGGYLLWDNWEMNALLSTTLTFTSPVTAKVTLGAGTRYYFDMDSVFYPYLGTQPAFSWSGFGAASNWSFRLPVMGGVLLGLNSHVALDLGASAGFTWQLNSGTNPTGFDLIVGYVGVKSFF